MVVGVIMKKNEVKMETHIIGAFALQMSPLVPYGV